MSSSDIVLIPVKESFELFLVGEFDTYLLLNEVGVKQDNGLEGFMMNLVGEAVLVGISGRLFFIFYWC